MRSRGFLGDKGGARTAPSGPPRRIRGELRQTCRELRDAVDGLSARNGYRVVCDGSIASRMAAARRQNADPFPIAYLERWDETAWAASGHRMPAGFDGVGECPERNAIIALRRACYDGSMAGDAAAAASSPSAAVEVALLATGEELARWARWLGAGGLLSPLLCRGEAVDCRALCYVPMDAENGLDIGAVMKFPQSPRRELFTDSDVCATPAAIVACLGRLDELVAAVPEIAGDASLAVAVVAGACFGHAPPEGLSPDVHDKIVDLVANDNEVYDLITRAAEILDRSDGILRIVPPDEEDAIMTAACAWAAAGAKTEETDAFAALAPSYPDLLVEQVGAVWGDAPCAVRVFREAMRVLGPLPETGAVREAFLAQAYRFGLSGTPEHLEVFRGCEGGAWVACLAEALRASLETVRARFVVGGLLRKMVPAAMLREALLLVAEDEDCRWKALAAWRTCQWSGEVIQDFLMTMLTGMVARGEIQTAGEIALLADPQIAETVAQRCPGLNRGPPCGVRASSRAVLTRLDMLRLAVAWGWEFRVEDVPIDTPEDAVVDAVATGAWPIDAPSLWDHVLFHRKSATLAKRILASCPEDRGAAVRGLVAERVGRLLSGGHGVHWGRNRDEDEITAHATAIRWRKVPEAVC